MASNDQDQTADSDDDGTATLFQIKLEVITKDFMSQKGGQSKGMFSVNVNTLEESGKERKSKTCSPHSIG